MPERMRRPVSGAVRRASAPPVERPQIRGALRDAVALKLKPEAERLREMTGKKFESWSV